MFETDMAKRSISKNDEFEKKKNMELHIHPWCLNPLIWPEYMPCPNQQIKLHAHERHMWILKNTLVLYKG